MFIAHIREEDFTRQTVQEHLKAVSLLSRYYGDSYGLGAHAELAGLLHDMGKYTTHFTNYLENAVLHNEISRSKIDHSTAGAKYLYEEFYEGNDYRKFVIEIIGMAILSHHSGLQNFVQTDLSISDYIRRVVHKELPYYDEVKRNFEAVKGNSEKVKQLLNEAEKEFNILFEKIRGLENYYLYINYIQKLVLSLLLDGDRTDTRRFEENDVTPLERKPRFKYWYKRMMKTINLMEKNKTPVNLLRAEMSKKCDQKAEESSGIYTLSIPTGGGKTFASLRYALKHASYYNKKRIIYVVPYTTILEQNADEVRKIIGDSNAVLEHHANVVDIVDEDEDYYNIPLQKKLQLGRDNWDYPIIFTTTVQFLNAFFAKGTRNTRRMHRLMESIIIFDEVQSIPYHHFSLFNTAVNFIHYIGNSSVLLCTATQPTVDKMHYSILKSKKSEIVPNLNNVVKSFERVSFYNLIDKKGWDAKKIADKVDELIIERDSILIILNTKRAVRNLFEQLSDRNTAHTFHLSTSMCPKHRNDILQQVKKKLGKQKVICISTQLIEAGVDISFEIVFRSLAGLDSIAQASGRCNRHAERKQGEVYIIKSFEENLKHLPEIRIGAEVMQNHILTNKEFNEDLLSPLAISTYFHEFDLQASREISRKPKGLDFELIDLINGKVRHNAQTYSISTFKTLEKHFEAIHSPTTALLVPYNDEAKELIADLNEKLSLKDFNEKLKLAQQYIVNVYQHELKVLSQNNLIDVLYEENLYVMRSSGYNKEYGLSLVGTGTMEDYQF